MGIYYITLPLVLFLAIISGNNRGYCYRELKNRKGFIKRIRPGFAWAAAGILIIISGLRYNVGADYGQYVWNYSYYKELTLNIKSFLEEPGIKIIAKISSLVYDDYSSMIFSVALVTIGSIMYVVIKESDNIAYSIFLFITLGIWTSTFNGIRQYLAVAIIFLGYKFIIQKQLVAWLTIVLIASLFHLSAIVCVVFYFLANREINQKQVFLCLFIAIVLLLSYDRIWGFIRLGRKDINTEAIYASHGISIIRVLVSWVPIIIYFLFCNRGCINDRRNNFFINMSLINAMIITAASNSAYFARIYSYSNMFNLVSIPLVLASITSMDNKRIIKRTVTIMYLFYWIYGLRVGVALDYRWIFDR